MLTTRIPIRAMNSTNRLGQRLKAIRTARKLTQEALAARMGRSVDAISNLERGKSLPNFQTIELLSQSLDIDLKTLFDFGGPEMPKRKAVLVEKLVSLAHGLSDADLELAVEQIQAIKNRSR